MYVITSKSESVISTSLLLLESLSYGILLLFNPS